MEMPEIFSPPPHIPLKTIKTNEKENEERERGTSARVEICPSNCKYVQCKMVGGAF